MTTPVDAKEFGCEFHHVQMYVDELQPLENYKKMEKILNRLAAMGTSYDPFSGRVTYLEPDTALPERLREGRERYEELCKEFDYELADPAKFTPAKQDVVEQLIFGLGWRVTAEYVGAGTRSVLVTSQDSRGVKIVATALEKNTKSGQPEPYRHFAAHNLERFFKVKRGFQGISALAFELPERDSMDVVRKRYEEKHPNLLIGVETFEDRRTINGKESVVLGSMEILEAYAYYEGAEGSPADKAVILRLVHREGTYAVRPGFGNPQGVLPGLEDVEANFDGTSIPAYGDHWVSNVVDRHSFLQVLEDVLGFTPKVDFNAGVIAAGRAQIESTVSGNNNGKIMCDSKEALRDQSQVYLPINNALTEVGHVHGFLKQIGQGVQHLASRVENLIGFIERVNNYRKMTGRGLSFLNIPAAYYGMLNAERDLSFVEDQTVRGRIVHELQTAGILSVTGIVRIDVTDAQITQALAFIESVPMLDRLRSAIKRARYSNTYKLLGDHFNEETYLSIRRNNILVDVQGKDALFQIFSCNILMRDANDEAPFTEYIQRVCSQKKQADGACVPIKPSCGGFGISNFLNLFLSIEVSKSMQKVEACVQAGDDAGAEKARKQVMLFTRQLEESLPILLSISDAMTAEADTLEAIKDLERGETKDADALEGLRMKAKKFNADKTGGNQKLQTLSKRYAELMESIEAE